MIFQLYQVSKLIPTKLEYISVVGAKSKQILFYDFNLDPVK